MPPAGGLARGGLLLAGAAVLCIATASVLVRWAAPLSSVEITFWRLAIAALAVALVALSRRQPLRYRAGDGPLLVGLGLVTALHFLSYIAAVNLTTIAHALSLTYTAPLFVAGLAAWRLGERLGRWQLVGSLIAVLGVAVLAGFEPQLTPGMLLGDGLALVSAATFGVYSVAGRALRGRYPLLTYTGALYATAALWLLPVAAVSLEPARYTPAHWLVLLALGLVPLGLGHTLYNAALRRLPAATVNIIATQEVTAGSLLAWLLLGETVAPSALLGVGLTLIGVALVLARPAGQARV